MKKIVFLSLALLVLASAIIFAFLEMRKEVALEMLGETPVLPQSRVRLGPNGEQFVSLDLETQLRVSITTVPAVATNLNPTLEGYARVLDPASLTVLLAEIDTAQVRSQSSSNELQRTQGLFSQGRNVSARTVELAEASHRGDLITLEAARLKLLTTFGSALAERPDLRQLASSLARLDAALVRVELPAGTAWPALPHPAQLRTLANSATPIEAESLGPAPSISPETQGQAFLFLARKLSGRLAPGQTLAAAIPIPGPAQAGVLVPMSAVLRLEGRTWGYIQANQTNFLRRPFALAHALTDAWFVTNGISAGEQVVIRGAQTLLSEEFKANIPVLAD